MPIIALNKYSVEAESKASRIWQQTREPIDTLSRTAQILTNLIEAYQLPRPVIGLVTDFHNAAKVHVKVPTIIDRVSREMAHQDGFSFYIHVSFHYHLFLKVVSRN